MAKDNQVPEEQKKEKKSPSIIILIVVMLISVVGAFFTGKIMGSNAAPVAKPVEVAIPDTLEDGTMNIDQVMISDLAINPMSKRKNPPILALEIGVEIKPKIEGPKEFEEKIIKIKDLVNSYFAAKNVAYLRDPRSKRVMKKELKQILNRLFEKSEVLEIYFPVYLIR